MRVANNDEPDWTVEGFAAGPVHLPQSIIIIIIWSLGQWLEASDRRSLLRPSSLQRGRDAACLFLMCVLL